MKRIFLLLIFIIGMLTITAGAEELQKYEELAVCLGLIEEFEDGTFRADAYITNRELASAVTIISENTEADAEFMKNNGYSQKELSAEEAALADDVVFAMVKLLGYPASDYKKTAAEAGIYKNAGLLNEYVTRKAFSRILYNTLTAEKLSFGKISDSGLVMKRDGNLLWDVFRVKRIDGIVKEDETAYITEKSGRNLNKGEILINGVIAGGIGDTKRYLGRRIEAFVQFEDESELYGTLLVAGDYKTDVIRATSEFIDGATTSSKLVWVDSKSEKMKTEVIPTSAVLIYNGVRMGNTAGQEWSLFTPGDGEVNLIDNNGDGNTDVVMVWSYIPYVLDYVNLSGMTIYDKNGRAPVELLEKNYSIFDSYGKTLKLEDLKEFDVLSIAFTADDGEIIIRKASNEPVNGIYNRKGYSIRIDNDEYSLGGWCSVYGISNGDRVAVYTDIYNRAAFIKKLSDYEYGYLTKLYFDETEDIIYLKMYSFDEKVCKKELADSVNVYHDGEKTKYIKNKNGDNSFAVLYSLIKEKSELIKYKLNSDGKIKELLFPKIKIWQGMPDYESGFEIYYGNISGESPVGREGKFLQNMFASRYRITNDTKLLSLEGNKNEPERFREITVSDMVADNDYYVTVYDVNEKFEAGAIVVDSVEGWYGKYGSIIERVSTGVNESGETVIELSVYTQGEKSTVKADNINIVCNGWVAQNFGNAGTKISELKVGDIIYYNLDNRGYIYSFAVLHKNKTPDEFYHYSSYGWGGNYIPNAAMAVAYCKVIKTYSDLIVLDIDGARPIGEYQWRNYYLCKNNRITKVDFSEIKPGDKVVGLWKWSNMNDLIIYR